MKTQKKNGQSLYLQKRNNRWKWMAGTTAAGMTASQAGAITINLVNNYISAAGGNHLNADLTGDGHPDLTIANAFHYVNYFRTYSGIPVIGYGNYAARVSLNGIPAAASRHNFAIPDSGIERLGSRVARFLNNGLGYISGTYSLTGSIPLFFKDLHINGGAPTRGFLQVTVSTRDYADIQLDSISYNTPTQGLSRAVPDQGSSLALLAVGASGILALRRWRAKKSSNPQLLA